MTATAKGLEALASDNGYEHYDKLSLRTSGKQGCPSCENFSCVAVPKGTGSLRFVVGLQKIEIDGHTSEENHPIRASIVSSITIKDGISNKIFYAFTTPGQP